MATGKTCPRCDTYKDRSEFYVVSAKRLPTYCKECARADNKERYIPRERKAYRDYERDGKRCPSCGIVKQLVDYHTHKSGKLAGKPVGRCKLCATDYVRQRRLQNPGVHSERASWKNLERNLGVTKSDYFRMFEFQGGVCAICKNPPAGKNRRLSVDHCHATGQVRALLCSGCNAGIGFFAEDITRLQSAIEYLKLFKPRLREVA